MYDSHQDTPSQLLRLRDPGIDNNYSQVDFPKLKKGGVDGAFWAIYTPPDYEPALAGAYAGRLLDAIYSAAAKYPSLAAVALSPSEASENRLKGLFSIFIGMENALPIGNSLAALESWYGRGVRYITLTHNADNAVADSAAGSAAWGGLSPFGREVLGKMNELGIMVDLSHSADSTFWDVLRYSKAPVIASHSCCRALCRHRRNLTDEMLRALAQSGGYVGINFYPAFLADDFGRGYESLLDEADAAEAAFISDPANPSRIEAWHRAQDRLLEMPRPGVKEIVDHVDHAVEICGIDHVGLGTDFDGITVTPAGLENVSKLPLVFTEMYRRGYTENDVLKVSGGNLMAVWNRVLTSCK
ncbi:MAG: dipeptidase [Bacteroidales bacterium]|nr:dipeptidase [Bacteroidales bacterium]